MTDAPSSPPPSPAPHGSPPHGSPPPDDATAAVTPPVGPPAATDRPVWTAPAIAHPEGPFGGPAPVAKRGLRDRTRSVVTRRVPVFAAVVALLVGAGVGGGVAVAATDGHGGDRTAADDRGSHDGDGRSADSRDGGRSGR